jgi:hypothetical protein
MRQSVAIIISAILFLGTVAFAIQGVRERAEAERIRTEADAVLKDAQEQIRQAVKLNEETRKAMNKQ